MRHVRQTTARALILRSGRSPRLEGRGWVHPSRRAQVRAPQSLRRNTDLILRSLRSKRLEGWTQNRDSRPSFETREGALLRMRSVFFTGSFARSRLKVWAIALNNLRRHTFATSPRDAPEPLIDLSPSEG